MGQINTVQIHPLSGFLHTNDPTCAHSASGHSLPSLIWRSFSTVHRSLLGVSNILPRLVMHECTPELRQSGEVGVLSRLRLVFGGHCEGAVRALHPQAPQTNPATRPVTLVPPPGALPAASQRPVLFLQPLRLGPCICQQGICTRLTKSPAP